MELEEAIEKLANESVEYADIAENVLEGKGKVAEDCKEYVEAINVVLNHLTKQEKMIQKIHENFCKFDWKNSNGEQVHNQLKELYESIFKNEESE